MKTQLKKFMVLSIVGTSLLTAPLASMATGIPVIDGMAAANAIQSLLQMKEQIDNQLKQLSELKSQVQAVSGARNLGNVATGMVKDNIPTEWQSVYSQATSTRTNYKDLLNGKTYSPETALKLLASNRDFSEKAFDELDKQLQNIEYLRNAINGTTDIKSSADLQNRIAVEQAKINNTQIKLDMMDRLYQQQEKIEKKKYAVREACMARHMFDKKYEECN